MFHRIVLSVFACSLLAACATQAPVAPVTPEQVSIHQSVVSAPPRYEIVKRLWVESWSSAFGVPGYTSVEDAMTEFRRHAANLGGNGVINFGCYRFRESGLACNGTVVRFL